MAKKIIQTKIKWESIDGTLYNSEQDACLYDLIHLLSKKIHVAEYDIHTVVEAIVEYQDEFSPLLDVLIERN